MKTSQKKKERKKSVGSYPKMDKGSLRNTGVSTTAVVQVHLGQHIPGM
jgi:hypothetical protein